MGGPIRFVFTIIWFAIGHLLQKTPRGRVITELSTAHLKMLGIEV